MQELRNAIVSNPEVLRPFIIGSFVVAVIVLIMIALKLRLVTSFSFRDFIELKGREKKEIDKKFELGTLKESLRNQIIKLDKELENFATEQTSEVKSILAHHFYQSMPCTHIRSSLVDEIRDPLFLACRNNNFKLELKPINIEWYVKRIMKKVMREYNSFMMSYEGITCAANKLHPCPQIPSADEMEEGIKKIILHDWAHIIKRKQIDICESKIKLYVQFIDTFRQIGDELEVRICEACIEKNRNYIKELKGE